MFSICGEGGAIHHRQSTSLGKRRLSSIPVSPDRQRARSRADILHVSGLAVQNPEMHRRYARVAARKNYAIRLRFQTHRDIFALYLSPHFPLGTKSLGHVHQQVSLRVISLGSCHFTENHCLGFDSMGGSANPSGNNPVGSRIVHSGPAGFSWCNFSHISFDSLMKSFTASD